MAFFLEQRALARHGETFEQTRAIASISLMIAAADEQIAPEETATILDQMPKLAQKMGIDICPLTEGLVEVMSVSNRQRIGDIGEQAFFENLRDSLDAHTGAMAVVLAAKVAAADGEVCEDELFILRPVARQLGFSAEQVEKLISASMRSASAPLH